MNANPLPSPLSGGSLNPNTKFLLYKKDLRERARIFRTNPTKAEKEIWVKILRNKKITGYKFTRQKPLDEFITDFYCSKLLLIIEIDGEIHNEATLRDKERDFILETKYKIKTIRYKNTDILNNIDFVLKSVLKEIKLRQEFLNSRIPSPPDKEDLGG